MRHHNVQPQPDLKLLSHEETAEREKEIAHESDTDTLTNLHPNFEKGTFFWKISITKEQIQHFENITRNQSNNSL